MDAKNTGSGVVKPLDADERIAITITAPDGEITDASYTCEGGDAARRCAAAVCRVIVGHGVTELFQMNNNAVYYNVEPQLGLHELYHASVAVLAAKRAAADWCRKNGVGIPAAEDGCACIPG